MTPPTPDAQLPPSKRLFALVPEPGMREYRSVDLLDIAHAMADVEFELAQQTARVEALEDALAQPAKDGAIGRIYPAHLQEWARQIRRQQHYDSLLTSWLARLGNEWDALANSGGEEKP